MSEHYDRQGEPISFEQWCRMFEDMSYKRIALTKVGEEEVSTVWLGLDHSFYGGPPLIFETMVFPVEEMERYTTEEEAIEGHARMVAKVEARQEAPLWARSGSAPPPSTRETPETEKP